eukprot:g77339.t1
MSWKLDSGNPLSTDFVVNRCGRNQEGISGSMEIRLQPVSRNSVLSRTASVRLMIKAGRGPIIEQSQEIDQSSDTDLAEGKIVG